MVSVHMNCHALCLGQKLNEQNRGVLLPSILVSCKELTQLYIAALNCLNCLALYDPSILPSSANQCILGNVYLRSDLPGKLFSTSLAMSLTSKPPTADLSRPVNQGTSAVTACSESRLPCNACSHLSYISSYHVTPALTEP